MRSHTPVQRPRVFYSNRMSSDFGADQRKHKSLLRRRVFAVCDFRLFDPARLFPPRQRNEVRGVRFYTHTLLNRSTVSPLIPRCVSLVPSRLGLRLCDGRASLFNLII